MPKKRGRPRPGIGSYTGPYRRSNIESARETLIGIIESKDTILWDRIKMKTGIGKHCEWNAPSGGFGEASCTFSHADLPQHDLASGSGTSNSQLIDLTAVPDRDTSNSQGIDLTAVSDRDTSNSQGIDLTAVSDRDTSNSQGIDLTAAPDRDTSLETPDTDCIVIEYGHRTTTDRSETGYGRDSLGKEIDSTEVSDLHCGSMGDAGDMDGSKVIAKDEHKALVQQEQSENESMSDGYEEMVDDDSIDVVQEHNRGGESTGTVHVTHTEREVSISSNEESMTNRADGHIENTVAGSSEPTAYAPRVILKCDFCAETANNAGLMMRHLEQSVHYSASSFHCSDDINNLTLHNRLVLTNKNALFKSVLAVCPADNCDIVFKTIFECSLHYKKKHDYVAPPTYALCSVTEEVSCDIKTNDMHCPVCKLVAFNKLELTKHMAITKHYPFEEKAGLHHYFYCRLCQQFRPTFSSAYSHRTPDHKGKMKDGILRLSVLYGTEKVVHHLPDDTQSIGTKREHEPETVLKKCKVESDDMVGLKEGYKCDYCDMASDFKDAVMSHMQKALHPSASLVLMDSSLIPVYIIRPLVLHLNPGKRAVMAICPAPNCDQTFMNPHYCCEHYSLCHGQGDEPTYAVSQVVKQNKLKYKWDNDCNSYTLPADVKTRVTSKSENATKCFVCVICKLTICSHDKMAIHLRQKHKGEHPKQRTVKLFWLSKVKVTQPILPYQNNARGELLAIDREIEALQELKKTSTKKSKKEINRKIKALKFLKKR